jgi:hypothetical protein
MASSILINAQNKKNNATIPPKNENVQIGNNNKNYQKTIIINQFTPIGETKRQINDLSKSKDLINFISQNKKA